MYLFQVACFHWMSRYMANEAIPLLVNYIAFVCMTVFCAVVPVILCRKMQGKTLYRLLFNTYDSVIDFLGSKK